MGADTYKVSVLSSEYCRRLAIMACLPRVYLIHRIIEKTSGKVLSSVSNLASWTRAILTGINLPLRKASVVSPPAPNSDTETNRYNRYPPLQHSKQQAHPWWLTPSTVSQRGGTYTPLPHSSRWWISPRCGLDTHTVASTWQGMVSDRERLMIARCVSRGRHDLRGR